MKKIIMICLSIFIMAGTSIALAADTTDLATKKTELVAFVDKAANFYKDNGETKAMAAFNDPKGGFQEGELYIFAVATDGLTSAHVNQKLVGKNVLGLKDPEGTLFIQEMIKVANASGKGWVDYSWTNPETKKVQAKTSYLVAVSKKLFLSAGIYK